MDNESQTTIQEWILRVAKTNEEKRWRAHEAEMHKQDKEVKRLWAEMDEFYAERKKETLRIFGESYRPS